MVIVFVALLAASPQIKAEAKRDETEAQEKAGRAKGGKEAMTIASALLMMLAETVALGATCWVGWRMWPRNRG